MKKLLSLNLLLFSLTVFAQNTPVNGITISMPVNPDANTANWGQGTSPFTITARTILDSNRQVSVAVTESRVLVSIKKTGSKVCGSYTNISAPNSGFNSAVKVWNGRNAVSLLGQDCILPPGDYELCVQFFGSYNGYEKALSEEKCKSFSIRGTTGTNDITYQPPQPIAPANATVIKEVDAKKPINFRWTPVVPKPQENITYRLKVWQLIQGQNATQAMRTNQPIVTKDVDNITQATVTNMMTEPCKEPYMCEWVWTVEALGKEQVQGIQKSYGVSEAATFTATNVSTVTSLACTSLTITETTICQGTLPANGLTLYASIPQFNMSWGYIITNWTVTSTQATLYNGFNPVTVFQGSPLNIDPFYTFQVNAIFFTSTSPSPISFTYHVTFADGSQCQVVKTVNYPPTCPTNISCNCLNWPATISYISSTDGFVNTSTGAVANNGTILMDNDKQLNFNNTPSICASSPCIGPLRYTLYEPNHSVLGKENWPSCDQLGLMEAPCGMYKLKISATCGLSQCNDFIIWLDKPCPTANPCTCGTWQQAKYMVNGTFQNLMNCGNITPYSVPLNTPVTFSGGINCNGGTSCLATGTYQIYKGSNLVVPPTNGFIANYTFPSCGNYKIVFKGSCDNLNCLDSCAININVPCATSCLPPTPIPIVTNVSYCQNEVANVLVAAGISLQWYTTASGGTGSSIAPIPSTATVGVTSYWVSQTVMGCESARTPILVTVSSKPVPPTFGNISYCQNAPTLPFPNTSVGSILWYNSATGGVGSAYPTPAFSTTVPGNFTYWATQTVNGCESDRHQFTIIVVPTPAAPIVSTVTYCQNAIASPLAVTGLTGGVAGWYTTATGGIAQANAPVPSTATVGTTTYWVAQLFNGCISQRLPVVVTVNNCDTCFCASMDTAKYVLNGITNYVKCNSTINISPTDHISYLGKRFACNNGASCSLAAQAILYGPDGRIIDSNNSNSPFTWPAPGADPFTICNGVYKAVFKGSCGNKSCDSCVVFINVQCPCVCNIKDTVMYTVNGITNTVKCSDTIKVFQTDQLTSIVKQFSCSDPSVCALSGTAMLYAANGSLVQQSTISGFDWSAGFPLSGLSCDTIFKLVLKGNCGTTSCDSCIIYIKVKCPPPPCNCGIWRKVIYNNLRTGAQAVMQPNTLITLPLNEKYSFQSSFTCNPQTVNCKPANIKDSVYYIGANNIPVLVKTGTGLLEDINLNDCGRYQIVFTAKCGTAICRSTLDILVDCCGGSTIKMSDKEGVDISGENKCLPSRNYNFNLVPAPPLGTPITWKLTTFPNNSSTTGTYNYNPIGQSISIPPYSCNTTSFQLIYSWNNGWCSDTMQKNICESPCCDFILTANPQVPNITLIHTSNVALDFFTTFNLPAGNGIVNISKIKIQLLNITVNNQPRPGANLGASQIITPAITSALVNNNAVITGDAVWFNSIPALSGPTSLVFKNRIVNLQTVPGGATNVTFKIRYTFYRNNGTCETTICEKEINY